ncbi:MAG: TonB-dependent receptor [Phenylobacterium sp.]|nr:MAG: TonB-dependent receptor [Phenylobacterium sp.]
MTFNLTRALCASTALATGMLLAGGAFAQSTATQVQELVVTGARGAPNMNGLAQQVLVAKDESVVSQAFIKTQIGSENFAQLINFLPGVTYSSEDPTGILSGDFRMHGLDCNHLSVTIDGSPVNDTGNYACFPGEYLVGELTDHVTVDIGATDVDSPTASAVGGQVNIISKVPTETSGILANVSGGSYRYERVYGELESGAIGPWGTRAYISGNYARADKYKGEGPLIRRGLDARVYQTLGDKGFVSLAANWASNRPIFYFSASRAQLAQFGTSFDYNPVWVAPTAINGHADTVPTPPTGAAALAAGLPANAGQAGSDTNFWGLHPNPVDFGQIRGSSLYHLTDKLTFTFDPSFFYTLANGGGGSSISEKDVRLSGNRLIINPNGSVTSPGVDLNGDGDQLDTVPVYTPSNTKTHRWVVTSSLLWDINDHNNIQLAYTYDYGRHRQTGEATFVDLATGQPDDQFGSKAGRGPAILGLDGSQLRTRDRFSIAQLNQFALNYIGKFFDDRLHINVGLRDPHFQRDINQYCYTFNGSTVECTSINPALVQQAFNQAVATHSTSVVPPGSSIPTLNSLMGSTVTFNPSGQPNFRFPFSATFRFDKVLPNAGVTYRIADDHLLYASYAQGFSAPKTDDLYTSSPDLVRPETSTIYSAGYRYQTQSLTASANLYDTEYKNRIVQSIDPNDATLSIDRNVGDVQIYGVDFEAGYRPMEHLTLYGSAAFTHSEIKNNLAIVVNGQAAFLPIAGKQLVMTPEREFSARAQYDVGPVTFGFEGKYISSRYITDTNDDRTPGYADFDLDLKYDLPDVHGAKTSLRLNVENLLNRDYISRSTTVNTAHPISVPLVAGGTTTFSPGTPFLSVGAPRTVYVTLNAEF